jgi:guanylate kinase
MEKRKNLYFSVSATTREARPGEENGVHYHFLKEETFHFWRAQGEFLEYAQYVGNFYGTPKRYVDMAMEEGKDVILDIEVQGAVQVAEKRPETVRIFVAPPSWTELERRLNQRGTDSPEKIHQRLQRAKEEMESASFYDYIVINDSVEKAVDELDAIMTAEHCRVQDRLKTIKA